MKQISISELQKMHHNNDVCLPADLKGEITINNFSRLRKNRIYFTEFHDYNDWVYIVRKGDVVHYTTNVQCDEYTDELIMRYLKEGMEPLQILEFLEL